MNIDEILKKLAKSALQEILINGVSLQTNIHNDGSVNHQGSPYKNNAKMYDALQDFAEQRHVFLNPQNPCGGGVIEAEQSNIRWHIILPPVASEPLISLRIIRSNSLLIRDFANEEIPLSLLKRVASHPIIFLGGLPGSGKTSLLTSLLKEEYQDQRVFILETLPEIPLLHSAWVRLTQQAPDLEGQGAFTLSQALQESLRMRPDHYVLGEIRGNETKAIFEIIAASETGVWTTIHCASPDHLSSRLESISNIPECKWKEAFQRNPPIYIQLQRFPPRITGVYIFEQERYRLLSTTKK